MKKTETKKPKTSRALALFGESGVETSLPVLSEEKLSTVVGGSGPKIPKNQAD